MEGFWGILKSEMYYLKKFHTYGELKLAIDEYIHFYNYERYQAKLIENMLNWHHSGFNVYCGPAINPGNQEGLEKLAQYIIRAPLSQERLLYIPASEVPDGIAIVIYRGKNSSVRESFMALDWLARLVTHIPNKGEQLVRYYGYYSNKSRGMRKKIETDIEMPALVESDISRKAFRRNWARLIQKIYHTDPLLCPSISPQERRYK
jgi:hypothetical protein